MNSVTLLLEHPSSSQWASTHPAGLTVVLWANTQRHLSLWKIKQQTMERKRRKKMLYWLFGGPRESWHHLMFTPTAQWPPTLLNSTHPPTHLSALSSKPTTLCYKHSWVRRRRQPQTSTQWKTKFSGMQAEAARQSVRQTDQDLDGVQSPNSSARSPVRSGAAVELVASGPLVLNKACRNPHSSAHTA